LNMQPETQGQSHQISNISIGPDGKLYVHNGDGINTPQTALNLDMFRGKILRMNLDGTAPSDNPFYNASDGTDDPRDYIFAYGFRNPFGGAWRASDGKHYEVENGPSTDRLAQVNRGVSYGWNGSNSTMTINAIYNWNPAHAPVNMSFVQPETFNGSQFPAGTMDHLFVSESGPTYATGAQTLGKRLVEFVLDEDGDLVSGPTTLVEYRGNGQASLVGLAAGPDGLYFTELYKDDVPNPDFTTATLPGARIFRVRYVNPIAGDYNIDGVVDQDDHLVWRSTFGSNLLLAADGNGNGIVDAADYVVWRKNLPAPPAAGVAASTPPPQPASQAVIEFDSSESSATVDAALADLFLSEKIESGSSRLLGSRSALAVAADEDALLLALPAATGAREGAPSDMESSGSGSMDEESSSEIDDLFAELQLELLGLR